MGYIQQQQCQEYFVIYFNIVFLLTCFSTCFIKLSYATVPLPTPVQLEYQQAELIATIGFQMDTYAYDDGDPGCNPINWNVGINTSNPATLNPTNLNVTQWAEVLSSFGKLSCYVILCN